MRGIELYDAAIIGGGVAGSVVAAALARSARPDYRAVLLDPRRAGPGTAYAPASDRLLMNGPARAMGVVPGDANHLVRWLGNEPEDALIARSRFGRYLSETLREALRAHPGITIEQTEVVDLDDRDGIYLLTDASGRMRRARNVILALGNFAPDDGFLPEAVRQHPGYVADPWTLDAARLGAGEIALLGSGLTAMDVIALLDEHGYRGRIHLISRHALLAAVEDPSTRGLDPATLSLDTTTPYRLLRSLRRAAERHRAAGGDWREVVEAIRSSSQGIWSSWSLLERRRFLRHLQSFWAIHRYRVPAATLRAYERFGEAIVRHRGRIRDASILGNGTLRLGVTHADVRTVVDVGHVVNATGPHADYARLRHPLVQNALRRGLIRPDALHLGLDADHDLRVVNHEGRAQAHLFALGPPLRGLLYETTAVPETREQAARIAQTLLEYDAAMTLDAVS